MKKKSNQINIPDNEWPKKGKYMRNFRPRSDKGPRYRTSLEMDGTLNFDCYSLLGGICCYNTLKNFTPTQSNLVKL